MDLDRNTIKKILDNAPTGSDPETILDGLVKRGYSLEGVDMNAARTKVQEQGEIIKGDNVGQGFDAPNQFTGEESFLGGAGKTARNLPSSAFNFGKDIVGAVTSPIETGKTIFGAVRGGGEKAGRFLLDKTPLGNIRGESGETLRETSKRVPQSEDEQITSQIVDFAVDRYGGIDRIKETFVEDPVGALADLAGVFTVAGGTTRLGTLSKVGKLTDPVSLVSKPVRPIVNKIRGGVGTAKDITLDVIPSLDNLTNQNVSKALDLSQADVRNFRLRTDQNVGDYLVQKQINGKPLLARNVTDTQQNVQQLIRQSYNEVRDEVSKVNTTYTMQDLPQVRDVLSQTSEQLKGIAGLESELAEVNRLLGQEQLSLTDVQRVKEIIDERHNIFKKSGDVAASDRAQGLANIREDIKTFIEDEVRQNTGADIRALNDDVRFGYAIDEAIEKGLTRDLTRNQFGISDYLIGTALGVGAFGGGISIPTAIGLFGAKKIVESPAFRLSVAQGLKRLPDNRAGQILNELRNNNLTQESTEILRSLVETAKDQAIIINPALADIERATENTQTK